MESCGQTWYGCSNSRVEKIIIREVSMKMKTILWTLGGAFIGLPILGWLIIYLGIVLSPTPPAPKITYGEFPFKLVYEINGERKTIEDTVICEYEGIGMNEGVMKKFRKWKKYLASGNNTRIELLSLVDADSGIHYNICYAIGSADYFMGATDKDKTSEISPPRFYENLKGNGMSPKELLERYNIKITTWETSPPIVNEFK